MSVSLADVQRARVAVCDVVRRTPVLAAQTLSQRCGGTVALKAENLQRTGSFKLRGALGKLAALGAGCDRGVVAGSAGNHAWALAEAARTRGVPCEVFMPAQAPIAKVEGCEALGARCPSSATRSRTASPPRGRARTRAGWRSCIRSTIPTSSPGRARSGSSCSRTSTTSRRSSCRSAAAGWPAASRSRVKSARPEIEVVGVQAAACAAFAESLRRGEPVAAASALTIADGIAVKRPGELTLALVRRWLDDVVTVGEDEIAEAMVLLMERSKLVVEGAGAVGVAALLGGLVAPARSGTTVVVLSGGNVDAGLLAAVTRRHETQVGRRLVLFTRLPDRPGSLARLLACVAEAGANLVEVEHVREGVDLHVRETAVQLVLETRGREHAQEVLAAIAGDGYLARVIS